MSTAAEFAGRVRAGEAVVGYWVALDNPVGTERIARTGYDYVTLDLQHGLIGYSGMLAGLMAIDSPSEADGPRPTRRWRTSSRPRWSGSGRRATRTGSSRASTRTPARWLGSVSRPGSTSSRSPRTSCTSSRPRGATWTPPATPGEPPGELQ